MLNPTILSPLKLKTHTFEKLKRKIFQFEIQTVRKSNIFLNLKNLLDLKLPQLNETIRCCYLFVYVFILKEGGFITSFKRRVYFSVYLKWRLCLQSQQRRKIITVLWLLQTRILELSTDTRNTLINSDFMLNKSIYKCVNMQFTVNNAMNNADYVNFAGRPAFNSAC